MLGKNENPRKTSSNAFDEIGPSGRGPLSDIDAPQAEIISSSLESKNNETVLK